MHDGNSDENHAKRTMPSALLEGVHVVQHRAKASAALGGVGSNARQACVGMCPAVGVYVQWLCLPILCQAKRLTVPHHETFQPAKASLLSQSRELFCRE